MQREKWKIALIRRACIPVGLPGFWHSFHPSKAGRIHWHLERQIGDYYFEEILSLARRSWERRGWEQAYLVIYSIFIFALRRVSMSIQLLVQLPNHRKKIGWWVVRVLFINEVTKLDLKYLQFLHQSSHTKNVRSGNKEYFCRWLVPLERARALFLATVDKGGVTLESTILVCERSMLDCLWTWRSVRRWEKRSVATRTRGTGTWMWACKYRPAKKQLKTGRVQFSILIVEKRKRVERLTKTLHFLAVRTRSSS